MTFKMTWHSISSALSPPSHLKILWPEAGGSGRILLRWPNPTSVQWLRGTITPSSWPTPPSCLLLRDTIDRLAMSPLNSWWPLVCKAGTRRSGIVTQEMNELDWSALEAGHTSKKGGRLGAQICSISPHPFLSSAICQRPGEGWHLCQSRGWHGAHGQHWQDARFLGWFAELITAPSALALSSSFLSNILSS